LCIAAAPGSCVVYLARGWWEVRLAGLYRAFIHSWFGNRAVRDLSREQAWRFAAENLFTWHLVMSLPKTFAWRFAAVSGASGRVVSHPRHCQRLLMHAFCRRQPTLLRSRRPRRLRCTRLQAEGREVQGCVRNGEGGFVQAARSSHCLPRALRLLHVASPVLRAPPRRSKYHSL
jgi:hypothetical protein